MLFLIFLRAVEIIYEPLTTLSSLILYNLKKTQTNFYKTYTQLARHQLYRLVKDQ